jgi:DNA-damage-inducible protein D
MEKPMVVFETIKRINEYGQEFWSARDLYKLLGYTEYGKFLPAIERAKEACKNSNQDINLHFAEMSEPQKSRNQYGEIKGQMISDYYLSRYACYLIAQNGDPRKEEIARAQTYFAIQTRIQEVQSQQIEDQKRVYLRDELTAHTKHLAVTATKAGVKNYGVFTNYGYMGLYGGMKLQELKKHKHLDTKQNLLDHVGSEELAANLFRATQTDAKIERERITGEAKANQTHFEVGRKVRRTIRELGGTMPEKLPTAEHIGKTKKRIKDADHGIKKIA